MAVGSGWDSMQNGVSNQGCIKQETVIEITDDLQNF